MTPAHRLATRGLLGDLAKAAGVIVAATVAVLWCIDANEVNRTFAILMGRTP